MPSPMQASTAATTMKMAGSNTSRGGPLGLSSRPKKMRSVPTACRVTGTKCTNSTSAPSTSGVKRSNENSERPAHKKPSPTPRNEPSSTMFEKYER
ncbi:unannotated protein [freshwater metagenome]|uniref:Unannotated protein n=1 Tax=freshwater metagenome TaxID=449393 RepID=A0A6J7IPK6_9ZZZZ